MTIPVLYTPEEVAKKVKTTRRTVYRWLVKGTLRGLRAGDTWRIAEQDLMAFLESRGPGRVAQQKTDVLAVPVRVEGPDGTIGDAVMDIGPQHPDYAKWQAYFRLRAKAVKKPARKPVKRGKGGKK